MLLRAFLINVKLVAFPLFSTWVVVFQDKQNPPTMLQFSPKLPPLFARDLFECNLN